MNTQQNQASAQVVIIVTQLREKANTRRYKDRSSWERRGQCISTVGKQWKASLGRTGSLGNTTATLCLLENMCRKEKTRCRGRGGQCRWV